MLHFALPAVRFSSSPHHAFCVSDSVCEGASHDDAVSTVCAPAAPLAAARTAAPARRSHGISCFIAVGPESVMADSDRRRTRPLLQETRIGPEQRDDRVAHLVVAARAG